MNGAFCPAWTVLAAAWTLMQSWVMVADPVEVAPGERLGVGPGGGEAGAEGSVWHTPFVPLAAPV
jgi:hypothetical protein